MSRLLIGFSRSEFEDGVSQAQIIVDNWITSVHRPTIDELMTLSEVLKKAKSAINLEGKYKASLAKIDILDKSLIGLQQELSENGDQIDALSAANETLRSEIDLLKEQFAELRQKFTPIEAKSIAFAVERRFVNFLLDQSPDLHPMDRIRYHQVEHIIDDYNNNDLSPGLRTAWEAHNKVWNRKLFKNIFNRLSYFSGAVCHEEDRDSQIYLDLSREHLEKVFDGVGCRQKEKQALLDLHMYTVTSVESPCLDDTGSV